MGYNQRMAKISVFLDEETHTALKHLATDKKTSLTKLIEGILTKYLGRRKDAAAA